MCMRSRHRSNSPGGRFSAREPARSSYLDFHMMIVSIVGERHPFVGLFIAVHPNPMYGGAGAIASESDVIKSLPIAVVDFESWPSRGQARREAELVHVEPQAE